MLYRTLSTLILWTIVFCALYFGGLIGGGVLLVLLSAAAQWEYYRLRESAGAQPWKKAGVCLGLLWLALVGAVLFDALIVLWGCLFAIFLWTALLFVLRPPSKTHLTAVIETVFGVFYVPFLMSFYILIMFLFEATGWTVWDTACGTGGLWLSVLVVAMAKFSDVGGLLFGKSLGKHKIAPSISPKKSWEGLLGSVLFSIGVTWVALALSAQCTQMVPFAQLMPFSWWLVLGALIALVGLISDLTESVVKRVADKKDSGGVIPGIGGALDLCDSLLFVAPLAFAYFAFALTVL